VVRVNPPHGGWVSVCMERAGGGGGGGGGGADVHN